MSTTAARQGGTVHPRVSFRTVPQGVVGGLAGGVVFGILMQATGMIPMVAMLVGSSSIAVGWVVHLAVSAAIGAGFGLLLAPRVDGLSSGVLLGLLYGAVWWVLGPLILMPAALGMPLFMINSMAWTSLIGHLLFGLTLGVVVASMRRHR